jgi:hypothetical protein
MRVADWTWTRPLGPRADCLLAAWQQQLLLPLPGFLKKQTTAETASGPVKRKIAIGVPGRTRLVPAWQQEQQQQQQWEAGCKRIRMGCLAGVDSARLNAGTVLWESKVNS